jgi:hypothetical protein
MNCHFHRNRLIAVVALGASTVLGVAGIVTLSLFNKSADQSLYTLVGACAGALITLLVAPYGGGGKE